MNSFRTLINKQKKIHVRHGGRVDSVLLTVLLVVTAGFLKINAAGTSTWVQPLGGAWGAAGNWSGGVPNATIPGSANDMANITTDINATRTITLDADQYVVQMVLGDLNGTNGYIIASGSASTNKLIFQGHGTSGNMMLTKERGATDTISANIDIIKTVSGPQVMEIRVNAGGLILSGVVTAGDGTSAGRVFLQRPGGAGILSFTNTFTLREFSEASFSTGTTNFQSATNVEGRLTHTGNATLNFGPTTGSATTTFTPNKGQLRVTGTSGSVNFGVNGGNANVNINAEDIFISGATLNLQNGNGAGVTTIGGNLLTITNGTVALNKGSGSTVFTNAGSVTGVKVSILNNGVLDIGTTKAGQSWTFKGLEGLSTSSRIISGSGNAVLRIGGDGLDDIFNGQISLTNSGGQATIQKDGTETLTLGGISDNSGTIFTVNAGTLLLNKDTSGGVHAIGSGVTINSGGTVKLAGTFVGGGTTPVGMANYVDQLYYGLTVTMNSGGVLDLNGKSEGFNSLNNGTILGGLVTNSLAGTTSTLLLGNNGGNSAYSGSILDGAGKIAFWKAGGGSVNLNGAVGNYLYTGETLVARGNLQLSGTGALTNIGNTLGTSGITLATTGQLFLDNSAATSGNLTNRIGDNTAIKLTGVGQIFARRSGTAGVGGDYVEKFGDLTIGKGSNRIAIDHSSGNNTSGLVNNLVSLTFNSYVREQGGVLRINQTGNNNGDNTNYLNIKFGFTNAEADTTRLARVQFLNSGGWLIGDSAGGAADTKILVGVYSGEQAGATDRFVTLNSSGYMRLLNPGDTTDFRARVTTATNVAVTAGNLAGVGSGTQDANFYVSGVAPTSGAFYTLDVNADNNQLKGQMAYNAWLIDNSVGTGSVDNSTLTVSIAENNILHLGGFAGDALHTATTGGSGMLFINNRGGTNRFVAINGGTLDFGNYDPAGGNASYNREAIIRTNANTYIGSTITGRKGLTKSGNSILYLRGQNTYSGITTLTEGDTRLETDSALGLSNEVRVVSTGTSDNVKVSLSGGVNVGEVGRDVSLYMHLGATLNSLDRTNVWNGNLFLDGTFATGQANEILSLLRPGNNASLIINGDITGINSSTGGYDTDPSLYGGQQGRRLMLQQDGTSREGIITINGAISDLNGSSGIGGQDRLNVYLRGYSGQSNKVNNEFNVFIQDAGQTNGVFDLRSGYVHIAGAGLSNSASLGVTAELAASALYGDIQLTLTADPATSNIAIGTVISGPGIDVGTKVTGIAGNVITLSNALIDDVNAGSTIGGGGGGTQVILRNHDGGNVLRPDSISALLLTKAGAQVKTPNFILGESSGNYSSKSVGILGGENTTGVVTFGNGATVFDMNPRGGTSGVSGRTATGASGATTWTLNDASSLRVGYGINGVGIAPGTVVTAISGNTVTLSAPTTAAPSGSYTFGFFSTGTNIVNANVAATGSSVSGDSSITVSSGVAATFAVGMGITGTGIQADTVITAIDSGTGVIKLSKNVNASIGTGSIYTVYNSANNANSKVINLRDTTGLRVGMGLSVTGFPQGTIITAIDTATGNVTLSHRPTAGFAVGTVVSAPLSMVNYNLTNKTLNFAAAYTSGTAIGTLLKVNSVEGLSVGTIVSGTGIAANTTVTSVNSATNEITLSTALNAAVSSGSTVTLASYGTGSTKFILNSVEGLKVGTAVSGPGIQQGTIITSIDGNVVTISQPTINFVVGSTSYTTKTPNDGNGGYIGFQAPSNYAEARLYQAPGSGISDYQTRFYDEGGYNLNNEVGTISKVGRGYARLSGASGGGNDLDGGLHLFGGVLEFNYSGATKNSRVNASGLTDSSNPYQLILGGGELRLSNTGLDGQTLYESMHGTFIIRPGNSGVTFAPQLGATILLNVGMITQVRANGGEINTAAYWREPDRFAGGTIQANYAASVGGGGVMTYSSAPELGGEYGRMGTNAIIPYATVKYYNSNTDKNEVDLGAFVEGNFAPGGAALYSQIIGIEAIAGGSRLSQANDVTTWNSNLLFGRGYYTDALRDGTPIAGYSGTLASNSGANFLGVRAIRFMADTGSATNTITLNTRLVMGAGYDEGNYYTARDGGVILISNTVGGSNQAITGGRLTSAYKSRYFTSAVNPAPLDTNAVVFDSRDLIIQNYNHQGVFTISSIIEDYVPNTVANGEEVDRVYNANDTTSGKLNLIVAGPGTTHLTGANIYTGKTYVTGGNTAPLDNSVSVYKAGYVWISDDAKLGAVPAAVVADNIYLNGGGLEFAHDTDRANTPVTVDFTGNDARRGIMLGGQGGYIKTTNAFTVVTYAGVIQSEPNVLNLNLAETQMAANPGVGDLIKEGAGKLVLTNSTARDVTGWNAYYGLTEVNAGILQVDITNANSGILGSSDSSIDRTIVRTEGRLDFKMIGSNASFGTSEWIELAGGVLGTALGHTDGSLDGLIMVTSNSGINIAEANTTLRFNPTAGFIMGNGNITKSGAGSIQLFANNSEFTGSWEINQGAVIGRSTGYMLGSGSTIVLGDSTSAATGSAQLLLQSVSSFTNVYEVNHNIIVRAEGGSTQQLKYIGAQNIGNTTNSGYNNDRYVYNGNIQLGDDVRLLYSDNYNNTHLVAAATNPEGSHQFGTSRQIVLNGSISGTGNINTEILMAVGTAVAVTPTFELNGNNSAWAGDLVMGNASLDGLTVERLHTVRLGNDLALNANNDVKFNYNNKLQVGGHNVVMGGLNIAPSTSTGTGASTNRIIIENASNTEGTITITENGVSPKRWDALFQDGVTPDVYSAATAQVHSNKLNVVKDGGVATSGSTMTDGTGTAVMTQMNTYTGTTLIKNGNLQVGIGAAGEGDGAGIIGQTGTGATTVNAGATLSGAGLVNGSTGITNHILKGILKPGNNGGVDNGTLSIKGNLTVSTTSSNISFGVTNATKKAADYAGVGISVANLSVGNANYNATLDAIVANWKNTNPTNLSDHDHLQIDGKFTIDGEATIQVISVGATFVQGDVYNLLDWASVESGTTFSTGGNVRIGGLIDDLILPTLTGDLFWDTSRFMSDGLLVVVTNIVPEPSRALLIMFALSAVFIRRRRSEF